MRLWKQTVVASALALALSACGMGMNGLGANASMGATPGGAQDVGLARTIIINGGVPRPDQFTVEGLYSEHDLALPPGSACDEVLCVGTASALAVGLDDQQRDFFVQLGMDTNISTDSFERLPLNLGVVIDTSGSMSGNLSHLREALHALVNAMHSNDRLALVEFSSEARVIQESTLVSDSDELHDAIASIDTGGSTNMEAGMMLGYETIGDYVEEGRMSRLMVFTDAMTNTGNTDEGSFRALVTAAAARDIGFTFFGFGGYFDAEFIDSFAHLRGANYRFVGAEDVEEIFVEELDFLVTPIAYDLELNIEAAVEAPIRATYGVPRADEHVDGALMSISTVFLSRRTGAIVARLDGASAEQLYSAGALDLGQVELHYETMAGEPVDETVSLRQASAVGPNATDPLYPSAEIQRTVAVTNMYLAMELACEEYHQEGSTEAGAAALDEAIADLADAHSRTHDPNLEREIELLSQLKANLDS